MITEMLNVGTVMHAVVVVVLSDYFSLKFVLMR